MKHYSFDEVICRKGTNCSKIRALQMLYGRTDLIPLWVADMDFATPPFILEALRERLQHPILGYTCIDDDYFPAIIDWQKSLHNWDIEKEWISFMPGVIRGLGFALQVFTKPGDRIITQPPVYHMFRHVIEGNGRVVVDNPLIRMEDGHYEMDFDHLATVANDVKMLVLCNPHNPSGRCWPKETLQRLADFCAAHNILVVSDEIHADIALFSAQHIPFASVSETARNNSITFGAPTKTFNCAGVVSSWTVVPNKELREPFFKWLVANEIDCPPMFSPTVAIAAYRHGGEWRKTMLRYVEENIDFVVNYCCEHIPGVVARRPEASFLIWLDCRALQLSHDALNHLFVDEAHLALNDGEMFGQGGEGFMRLNVGVPRSILEKALSQLAQAVTKMHTAQS